MSRPGAVLVVCGLRPEAKIAAGPGIVAVMSGGRSDLLRERLDAIPPDGIRAVVSFGLAGGLDPRLRVGDVLVPDAVTAEGAAYPAASALTDHWLARLRAAEAGIAPILRTMAGVDRPALTAGDKAGLRDRTGAAALDMESHVAAGWGARHALPFAALRVVSDEAGRSLPPVAGRAMRPDGSIDVGAVLAGLARSPGQLPALIGTARDASRAFAVLRRVRGLLGPRLGLDL